MQQLTVKHPLPRYNYIPFPGVLQEECQHHLDMKTQSMRHVSPHHPKNPELQEISLN